MTDNQIPCLYCQTMNQDDSEACSNCGMPIAEFHPEDRKRGVKFFGKVFWLIAIFCIIMVFYLPR